MKRSPSSSIQAFKDLSVGCTFYWLPRRSAGQTPIHGCYQKISRDIAAEIGTGLRHEFYPDELVLLRLDPAAAG